MTFAQLKAEIEKELYAALEALESDDLITVRQCTARAHTDVHDMWKLRRQNEQQEVEAAGIGSE